MHLSKFPDWPARTAMMRRIVRPGDRPPNLRTRARSVSPPSSMELNKCCKSGILSSTFGRLDRCEVLPVRNERSDMYSNPGRSLHRGIIFAHNIT